MVPNLYSAPLDSRLLERAKSDPFGTVTLWTYFKNCLHEASRRVDSSALTDDEIYEAAQVDLVYASFLVFARTSNITLGKKEIVYFLRLLNRCVISNPDIVDGAISFMQEDTGISAVDTPSILQSLLAITIKHHNHDVLRQLTTYKAPEYGIFRIACSLIVARLKDSGASQEVWHALVAGDWIKASEIPDGSASTPARTLGEFEIPGNILRSCVKDLPSAELRSYFPSIPRSLYTGTPPYAKWPGDLVLVKFAAARIGQEGLEVLKLLVEVGGMDIDDGNTWWKGGDYDPRAWNPKCNDGSDCQETPLHIAVDKENLAVVEYLLTHGAKSLKDGYGRDQLDRALFRGNQEVVDLFTKYNWKKSK